MGRCSVLGVWAVLCTMFVLPLTWGASAAGIAPVVHALDPPVPDPDSAGTAELWTGAAGEDLPAGPDACGACGGAGCDTCQGVITVYGAGLRLFGGVEYLQARPTSSEPLAFVRQVRPTQSGPDGVSESVDQDVHFDYDRQDTVRASIGLRQHDCRSELRFTYWHLRSDDQLQAVAGTDQQGNNIAYALWDVAAVVAGDSLVARSDLTGHIYDLQYRRCLRPMDECDSEGYCCLPWDFHWSAGVRMAQWDYTSSVVSTAAATRADVDMDFDGSGPLVGLHGRRILRILPSAAAYASFQTGLLLGEWDHRLVRTAVVGPNTSRELFLSSQDRIVPVTELEVGLEWRFGRFLTVAGGWFQQVWWDLGVTEDTIRGDIRLLRDDSNILAWDGLGLRAEFSY